MFFGFIIKKAFVLSDYRFYCMSVAVIVVFVMTAFESLGYEDRREVGKDIGLYECNQYFDQIDKQGQGYEERRGSPAEGRVHGSEDENQDDEAEDDDVSRDHVGEKTDDQG